MSKGWRAAPYPLDTASPVGVCLRGWERCKKWSLSLRLVFSKVNEKNTIHLPHTEISQSQYKKCSPSLRPICGKVNPEAEARH